MSGTGHLAEVLHQHQLAAGLLDLRIQDPRAVGRDRQTTHRTQIERLFKTGDRFDLIGCEAQELEGGSAVPFPDRNEIYPAVHYRHIEISTQTFQNLGGLATFYRDLPQISCLQGFHVVQELAVRRLQRREPAIARHLDRLAALRWNFPNLLLARAGRVKIDPSAVPRPAWISVIRWMRGHALWFPSVRADRPDVVLSVGI